MKKSILIVILAIVLLTSTSSCDSATVSSETAKESLTTISTSDMSNYNNQSCYYVNDGWIYYMKFDFEAGEALLAKVRTDGTDYTKLTSDKWPSHINVVGEYIYAVLYDGSESYIYRCRLGGNDLEKVVSDTVSDLRIENDKLYYNKLDKITNKTQGYYTCDLDGNNEEVLIDKETYYNYLVGNVMYYQDDSDGETYHSYNIDTKEDEKITEGYSYGLVVDGDYGYYIKNDKSALTGDYVGDLMKINLKTKEESVLYSGASTFGFHVTDDSIFFINSNDNGRIYTISKDGSDIKLITQDKNCYGIAIYDNNLFYYNFGDGYESIVGMYICSLDGSNKIEI